MGGHKKRHWQLLLKKEKWMTKKTERRNLRRRIQGVTMPIGRKRTRWGRNWPCLCGSGKKYKHCCIGDIDALTASDGNADVTKLPEDIQKMIDAHRKAEEEAKGKLEGGRKING